MDSGLVLSRWKRRGVIFLYFEEGDRWGWGLTNSTFYTKITLLAQFDRVCALNFISGNGINLL